MWIWDRLLDIIYPPKCMYCGELIGIGKDRWLCEDCLDEIKIIEEPRCEKCGRPLDAEGLCADCRENKPYYEKGWAVYEYKGNVRNAIRRYKYKNHKEYAIPFGRQTTEMIEGINAPIIDCLVPVPLYYKKKKRRGYNQSELLAMELSRNLGIEMCCVLDRVRDTKVQSNLKPKERMENVKGAFRLREDIDIQGKKILLVDDIYTTGSTINECSKVLKKNGAVGVWFVCLSVAVRKNN